MVDQTKYGASKLQPRKDVDGVVDKKHASPDETSLLSAVMNARNEKWARKVEAVNALREAKLKQRLALSAEKKAIAKEVRAAKLAKKAKAAQIVAESARANAKNLGGLAAMAEQAVRLKYAELKEAVKKLRHVESASKILQKKASKQYKVKHQKNKSAEKGQQKRLRKINGFNAAGAGSS